LLLRVNAINSKKSILKMFFNNRLYCKCNIVFNFKGFKNPDRNPGLKLTL
jgi:hypothetical protein